jgi:hypothetical protein
MLVNSCSASAAYSRLVIQKPTVAVASGLRLLLRCRSWRGRNGGRLSAAVGFGLGLDQVEFVQVLPAQY